MRYFDDSIYCSDCDDPSFDGYKHDCRKRWEPLDVFITRMKESDRKRSSRFMRDIILITAVFLSACGDTYTSADREKRGEALPTPKPNIFYKYDSTAQKCFAFDRSANRETSRYPVLSLGEVTCTDTIRRIAEN